jgi:hypothetical protein
MDGGWVLEVDLRKFFDTVDHKQMQEFVRRRVQDGVILRLIGKWLNAGVLEQGSVSYPERGTPQGGVISPLLANLYLHEVLDTWWERDVKPRLKGAAHLVRYADDFVLVFEDETDAKRVQAVLPKRFEKFGLQVHPEKTRLVRFESPGRGNHPPGQFDLLGFTWLWERSRRGNWVIRCLRPAAASGGACSGSCSGAMRTGTTRFGCSSKGCASDCEGTMPTTASRGTGGG